MKKILYYIPFVVFGLFYALILFSGTSVSPVVWLWLALFLISGILMGRNLSWGAMIGMLPALHMIYMGTKDTGQIINEIPIGTLVLIFYAVCFYVCKKAIPTVIQLFM